MKTYTYLLAFWLAAVPWPLAAEELPILFARSGQKAAIPVRGDDGKSGRPVALWAFGQRWGEPATVKSGAVEFVAPKVRVPVVFRLIPADGKGAVLAELVVYPDRPVAWDKNIQLLAIDTPEWFDTWREAVGLPVRKFQRPQSLNAGNWPVLEKPGLLIVGRKAAGNDSAVLDRFAVEHTMNVLVLESDWFGGNETASREIVLAPKNMTGPLADLQTQTWSLPPTFRQRVLRISNRQTWIAGPGFPLVEEIRSPLHGIESQRIVWSYLPWQGQLGRAEMADELFLRLLKETAKGAAGRAPLDGRWRLLYPEAKDIKPGDRPVLAAALKSVQTDAGGENEPRKVRGYVLDLRGETPPPADFFADAAAMKMIEARIGAQSPLVILGDKAVLDTWKWLGLDRAGQQPATRASPRCRPGVVWWPDNSLPPSLESQLRLMQLFTEWNISLGNIPGETNDENRKNEP